MGPTWPFLLTFESRVEGHSFCGIETFNGYMYFASLWVVNGPLGRGVIAYYHSLSIRIPKELGFGYP